MAKKPLSEAQQAALAAGRAKRDANRQNPQTNTPDSNPVAQTNLITLTQDQFDALISRLNTGNTTDKAHTPSMSPGGMQTNPFGQVVGTITKYNIDPGYYPDPVQDLLDYCDRNVRMRRHNVRENYFIVWEITAKPYPTKDNMMIQEPTFHLTLYANEFDDEGEATGRAIVIQALHMNEDSELASQFAAEQGIEVTEEGLRQLMDETRFERSRRWLEDIFYPPRNFELTEDAREEAIGGSVVKVVTKSNVKGFGNKAPKITDEELV